MLDMDVNIKTIWKRDAKRILFVVLSALLMSANIRTFVQAGELYPGGATGLTILILRACDMFFNIKLPYTIVNVIINAIPVYIGFRYIGKKFTLYSCLMILLTGIFTDLLPSYTITYDTLLISIFGGIINGVSISLCLYVNATSGGTDFIAIYLSEKRHRDAWNIVLGVNIIILSAAGLLFGWDKALYSIIFQFASTQILHTLYKKYQQATLLIVTTHPDEVCEIIARLSEHTATLIPSEGAYEHSPRTIVYSVVSQEEYPKINKEVRKIDPDAFINTIQTEKLIGNFYQRPTE